jgi:uncharacterized protein (TIGR02594 family)
MGTTVRPNVYETPEELAVVHASGWVRLPSGLEITCTPLVAASETGLFAHLDYESALKVAARERAELIHFDTVTELHVTARAAGLELAPVILPPDELMASLARCRLHDGRVFAELERRGWDGKSAVANAGKHWIAGAPKGRAYLRGWWDGGKFIQAGATSGPGPHDDSHEDYATTTVLQRPGSLSGSAGAVAALPASAGLEHLARAVGELGVKEIPGTPSNPRIEAYLAVALRDGRPLNLRGDSEVSWCACFASWCGLPPGMTPRAAVSELVADARAQGRWYATETARAPAPGDLAIFKRAGGDPRIGGNGHVARVEISPDATGAYVTIGGNEADQVRRTLRSTREPDLVGWIVYG